jgi:hypothetical protein
MPNGTLKKQARSAKKSCVKVLMLPCQDPTSAARAALALEGLVARVRADLRVVADLLGLVVVEQADPEARAARVAALAEAEAEAARHRGLLLRNRLDWFGPGLIRAPNRVCH